MYLNNEELGVVFQTLGLAELYYKDPNRVPPKGMVAPNAETVALRLQQIEPVLNKIMNYVDEELKPKG